jgi:uncharacterized pyridoxamine 5'-phosphate oxidase family protein
MKPLKIVALAFVAYAAIIVAFELLIGGFQPADESTLVITSFDSDGDPHDRVVSPLESNGQLYVATNHWIRGWYNRVLENPEVHVTLDAKTGDYRAVPVTGVEHDRVASENKLGVVLRILTGFPPRYFVRLDPR